jgi:membrane-bound lytic murein transglycosylase B
MRSVLGALAIASILQLSPQLEAQPTSASAATLDTPTSFAAWLQGVREEALKRGIKPAVVREALEGVEPVAKILERDSGQAEFTLSVDRYLRRRLTRETVRLAIAERREHDGLLDRIGTHYGVQPRFLIALWGLESNFGRFSGVRPTVPALATLAYDSRRSDFFRAELFDALTILDRGDIALEELRGSWAGALGQPQFMPSSYLKFAQDFDGDGRTDIWDTLADVFASIAFYLKSYGWVADETWGRKVQVPRSVGSALSEIAPLRDEGCRAERVLTRPLPLAKWRELGVRSADGSALPAADLNASLVQGNDSGTHDYLVYRNYETLLKYNCATAYALSIGLLADYADGLIAPPREERPKAKRTVKKKTSKKSRPSSKSRARRR